MKKRFMKTDDKITIKLQRQCNYIIDQVSKYQLIIRFKSIKKLRRIIINQKLKMGANQSNRLKQEQLNANFSDQTLISYAFYRQKKNKIKYEISIFKKQLRKKFQFTNEQFATNIQFLTQTHINDVLQNSLLQYNSFFYEKQQESLKKYRKEKETQYQKKSCQLQQQFFIKFVSDIKELQQSIQKELTFQIKKIKKFFKPFLSQYTELQKELDKGNQKLRDRIQQNKKKFQELSIRKFKGFNTWYESQFAYLYQTLIKKQRNILNRSISRFTKKSKQLGQQIHQDIEKDQFNPNHLISKVIITQACKEQALVFYQLQRIDFRTLNKFEKTQTQSYYCREKNCNRDDKELIKKRVIRRPIQNGGSLHYATQVQAFVHEIRTTQVKKSDNVKELRSVDITERVQAVGLIVDAGSKILKGVFRVIKLFK